MATPQSLTSSPVELSTLSPTTDTRPHDPPISPLSPATETFATPPTSARHSAYASALATESTHSDPLTTFEAPATTGAQEHGKSEVITATITTDAGGIGPATSSSKLTLAPAAVAGSEHGTVQLTLLHPSGLRHPFVLNSAYLKTHNVSADDAWSISVYTLKELIWRDWREEWEERPTSPGSVRLISFGRLLDDKSILKDLNLDKVSANVIHMTVRPADLEDEDGTSKKGRRRRADSDADGGGGGGGAGCCRCCLM